MSAKTHPLGICDHCLGPIPPSDWYTSKRKPRLYCSLDCRNTANSRAGAKERGRKTRTRVQAGTWQNPAHLHPPTGEEQSARARKGRLREVAEGRWRNPGLTETAREINSRPHKHTGPLAAAIDRLKAGARMTDLSAAEADAYRLYRRQLRAARRAESNAYHRQRIAAIAQAEGWGSIMVGRSAIYHDGDVVAYLAARRRTRLLLKAGWQKDATRLYRDDDIDRECPICGAFAVNRPMWQANSSDEWLADSWPWRCIHGHTNADSKCDRCRVASPG